MSDLRIVPLGTGALKLEGEVDLAAESELQKALDRFPGPLTLDLAGLTFMDSTGIKLILDQARKGTVTLTRVPPNVMRVFEVAGVVYQRGLKVEPEGNGGQLTCGHPP
jgi:anti-anti-sigma factor